VTGLLPHAVRDAIAARGDFEASASFGVVAFVVLIVVLVEHEVLRAAFPSKARLAPFFIAAAALSVAVGLTIAVRIGHFL
jgi:hypothetical protein